MQKNKNLTFEKQVLRPKKGRSCARVFCKYTNTVLNLQTSNLKITTKTQIAQYIRIYNYIILYYNL
jgi:hypothetical protein